MKALLSYQLAVMEGKVDFSEHDKPPSDHDEVMKLAMKWHAENNVDPETAVRGYSRRSLRSHRRATAPAVCCNYSPSPPTT